MPTPRPKLSIIVAFFNMGREAVRTLHSLRTEYQAGISEDDYEVIALDSNSTSPLDPEWVESIQPNFHYRYVTTDHPSPCKAMNTGIEMARADNVACIIDGARILSPGILSYMMAIHSCTPNALIQTLSLHIGHELQNDALKKGYNQEVEDQLIATVDWKGNGYLLFEISSLAGSSKRGYLHPIAESNCFSVAKRSLNKIGGFDERFSSTGGGLVNLDVFNQLNDDPEIEPYMLLGEATFHQFHGGVATNVPREVHPFKLYAEEYMRLRGKPFSTNQRRPTFYGRLDDHSMGFLLP